MALFPPDTIHIVKLNTAFPEHGKKIALGMSGGVDSSVCALLLKEQGYDVHGVFLECWRAPGCRAEEDRKDALAIALRLGIPFTVLDFKQEYRDRVVEYFFSEYAAGRTPNPDVMCNREIKFGLFYDWAMEQGFNAVATGHYARIVLNAEKNRPYLARGVDEKKDQSYFLHLLRGEQLGHIVFPIGELKKPQVRALAARANLLTAQKPDSQGICFIGEINVTEFLRERLGENPGEVVNTKGEVIGEHRGLWFYTIGQRHGFTLKGKIRSENNEWKHVIPPFYVISKNAEKNQLVVGYGEETLRNTFTIRDMHWMYPDDALLAAHDGLDCLIRIRHGGKLYMAHISLLNEQKREYSVFLEESIQGIAEGQSAVLYCGERCMGGGAIR